VPKHEIFHKAGEAISDEVRFLIEKYFSPKEIEKLERLGGRLLISVAAPYKPKTREKVIINDKYIEKLKSIRNDSQILKKTLDLLTVKQLREICVLLNQPVRSNAVGEEIKRELIRNLQSEDYWQKISTEST